MMELWLASSTPISVAYAVGMGLFLLCFVTQSLEFHSAGISPENLLKTLGYLGSEEASEGTQFIQYHVRKSSGILSLHSFLPLAFLIGNAYCAHVVGIDARESVIIQIPSLLLNILWAVSILLPISVLAAVYRWTIDDWKGHPAVRKLLLYGSNWRAVGSDINTEFRRIDKLVVGTNPAIGKVVVTDNWIIKVGQWPWAFNLAHQSDVKVEIVRSDNFNLSTDGSIGGSQILSINVANRRTNATPFSFRLNSLEYQNLQDRIRSQILNEESIQILKSVSERFVEVFREEIEKNAKVEMVDSDLDSCIGCMIERANVTIKRLCGNTGENPCVSCYCRPMWCIDCMGKWFASRQDQQKPETWLGSKCPCPTCRSQFCILDVSLINAN